MTATTDKDPIFHGSAIQFSKEMSVRVAIVVSGNTQKGLARISWRCRSNVKKDVRLGTDFKTGGEQ